MKLNITISKTSTGDQDYLQVISEDQTTINIVLLSEKITVSDRRPKGE